MKSGAITRAGLIKICNRLGYRLSARQITDWVQKGLLPPLQQLGRGRGRGKEYFWSDPEVITQATVVSTYLAWTHRAEVTLLLTWFAGFPTPIDRVRSAWLRLLSRETSLVAGKFRDPFDLEESIRRAVRRQHKESLLHQWPMTLATSLSLAVLTNEFDPLDALTVDDERRLTQELEQLLHESGDSPKIGVTAIETVKRGLHFLHRTFSPQQRLRIVELAATQDLINAQRDWRELTHFASATLRHVLPGPVDHRPSSFGQRKLTHWYPLWWRLVGALGPHIILLDCALRQAGYREAMNASIVILSEARQKVDWAAELRWARRNRAISPQLMHRVRPLIEQILRIWRPVLSRSC